MICESDLFVFDVYEAVKESGAALNLVSSIMKIQLC